MSEFRLIKEILVVEGTEILELKSFGGQNIRFCMLKISSRETCWNFVYEWNVVWWNYAEILSLKEFRIIKKSLNFGSEKFQSAKSTKF
jgi:hypothetical protein